jgi:hypothetical protein
VYSIVLLSPHLSCMAWLTGSLIRIENRKLVSRATIAPAWSAVSVLKEAKKVFANCFPSR